MLLTIILSKLKYQQNIYIMKGFKQCTNGHYYRDNLNECPYCPKSAQTKFQSNNSNLTGNNDETVVEKNANTQAPQIESTQYWGPSNEQPQNGNHNNLDLTKTYIGGYQEQSQNPNGEKREPRQMRMLVGWLVSYTINEMGVDFRLYEGQNTVGKNPDNAVTISTDNTVSKLHVIIYYSKLDNFLISDEFSANGTYVNSNRLRPRHPYELNDGDIIQVANTLFKFKSAL